mmetsp:Transcript_34084/g.87917  ORF Transcript_34084/g.87917 Transcript_34084/m.87917 type:complete len:86 (+) Transcript_34084:861-1118(+)
MRPFACCCFCQLFGYTTSVFSLVVLSPHPHPPPCHFPSLSCFYLHLLRTPLPVNTLLAATAIIGCACLRVKEGLHSFELTSPPPN